MLVVMTVVAVPVIIASKTPNDRETGHKHASSNPFEHWGHNKTRVATTCPNSIIFGTLPFITMALRTLLAHIHFSTTQAPKTTKTQLLIRSKNWIFISWMFSKFEKICYLESQEALSTLRQVQSQHLRRKKEEKKCWFRL